MSDVATGRVVKTAKGSSSWISEINDDLTSSHFLDRIYHWQASYIAGIVFYVTVIKISCREYLENKWC